MTAPNFPFIVRKFPVRESGVYENRVTKKYEFHFYHEAKKRNAKIGECDRNLPREIILKWQQDTRHQLEMMLAEHV